MMDFSTGFAFANANAAAQRYAYWRLLAAAPLPQDHYWIVREIKMMDNAASDVSVVGGGQPIANGFFADGNPFASVEPSAAFDGVLTNATNLHWASAQRGAAINGVSWIGYHFPSPKLLRRIDIVQESHTNPYYTGSPGIAAVTIQASIDGLTWISIATPPIPAVASGAWATITW